MLYSFSFFLIYFQWNFHSWAGAQNDYEEVFFLLKFLVAHEFKLV
jgi:hypothetical protein